MNALDATLQQVPQAKIDAFTNGQLDVKIGWVGETIDDVRKIKPAAADAIVQDRKLQLGIADYRNQFGHGGPQLAEFLAGTPTPLASGTIHAGSPPTREDIQTFIGAGKFGQNPANAHGIAGRETHFNEAIAQLNLGAAVEGHSHDASKTARLLKQGAHGEAVTDLQTNLAALGYLDATGLDGSFGMGTRHAVERFQDEHGLTVDGEVGSHTAAPLHAAVRDKQISDFVGNLASSSQPCMLGQYQVKTGDPYMDKLLNSDLNDPAAFKQGISELFNSAAGQAFRAEGQAMHLEQQNQQNQQLQTQVTQQQTQIQAQAQAPVQTGPVMTR